MDDLNKEDTEPDDRLPVGAMPNEGGTHIVLDCDGGAVGLRDVYRGCSAFLIGGGPSFAEIDPALLELARDADLLIHDAQYTEAQYAGEAGPKRVGWGHSTYVAACQVAKAAEAKRLALFHHDPAHEDPAVEAIERDAQGYFPHAFAARERTTIDV